MRNVSVGLAFLRRERVREFVLDLLYQSIWINRTRRLPSDDGKRGKKQRRRQDWAPEAKHNILRIDCAVWLVEFNMHHLSMLKGLPVRRPGQDYYGSRAGARPSTNAVRSIAALATE